MPTKDTLYYEGLVFDGNNTEQLICTGKSEGVVHRGAGKKILIISSFEGERIAMANNRQLGIVAVARRWHLQGEEVSLIASAPMVSRALGGHTSENG